MLGFVLALEMFSGRLGSRVTTTGPATGVWISLLWPMGGVVSGRSIAGLCKLTELELALADDRTFRG